MCLLCTKFCLQCVCFFFVPWKFGALKTIYDHLYYAMWSWSATYMHPTEVMPLFCGWTRVHLSGKAYIPDLKRALDNTCLLSYTFFTSIQIFLPELSRLCICISLSGENDVEMNVSSLLLPPPDFVRHSCSCLYQIWEEKKYHFIIW